VTSSSPRRDPGDEGPHPQLPGAQGRGLRLRPPRSPKRPPLARLLARLRPPPEVGQAVRGGHQVLQERPQVGQGQHSDPQGPLASADSDEGSRRIQGLSSQLFIFLQDRRQNAFRRRIFRKPASSCFNSGRPSAPPGSDSPCLTTYLMTTRWL
jgi:hypothetical protein